MDKWSENRHDLVWWGLVSHVQKKKMREQKQNRSWTVKAQCTE